MNTRSIKILLPLAVRHSVGTTIELGLSVLASAVLALVPVLSAGWLVEQGMHGNIPRGSLLGVLVAISGATALQQVLRSWIDVRSEHLGRRLGALLDIDLAQATAQQPPLTWTQDQSVRALITEAIGPTARLTELHLAVGAVCRLGQLRLQAAATGVLLIVLQPVLGTVTVISYFLVAAVVGREYADDQSRVYGEGSSQSRTDYIRDTALNGTAIKEIKVFGLSSWLADQYQESVRSAGATPVATRRAGRVLLAVLFMVVSEGILFLLIASRALASEVKPSVVVITGAAIAALMGILSLTMDLLYEREGFRRLPAVLALGNRIRGVGSGSENSGEHATGYDSAADPISAAESCDIELRNVTFTYPGSAVPVIKGLSVVLRDGETVGLVGLNGAGKSTLVKLLCGVLEPDSGEILLAGRTVSRTGRAAWQRQFSVVLQEYGRYPMGLWDNIDLARIRDSDADVVSVAERTGILALPERAIAGTAVLSSRYPDGVDLSGGQWQRIAVARALYATEHGASCLVLDEPTAALDPRAEAAFYDDVIDRSDARVTVLISHRFATVRRADRILTLQDGVLVEDGSHDELLAAGGSYATMFNEQAARYDLES